jgi:hypothetical protein
VSRRSHSSAPIDFGFASQLFCNDLGPLVQHREYARGMTAAGSYSAEKRFSTHS